MLRDVLTTKETNMSRFYRIAMDVSGSSPLGTGPYNSRRKIDQCFDYRMDGARHPPPHEDGGLAEFWRGEITGVYAWRFGFSSKSQARAWFYKRSWLEWMDAAGYVLLVCEVPKTDFKSGWAQAIARAAACEVVETRSVLSLVEE